MNITEILRNKTASRCLKHLVALKPINCLLAPSVGAFLALCASFSAHAQTVYSINIVGYVPERTAYLLSAPLTLSQRQAFHAQTFNQLPPSSRALYLRVVAYAVGMMVGSDGQPPSSAALAEYMKSASSSAWPDDWEMPWLTSALLAHKAVVKEAMQELNTLIAPQVNNNSAYQLAMDAGATDSFWWWDDWVVCWPVL